MNIMEDKIVNITEKNDKKVEKPSKPSINDILMEIGDFKNYLIGCDDFNNKFELDELINKGGSGYVYKGHLKKNHKKFVILKFLFGNINKNKKEDDHEIYIHNKLRNQYICEVYAYYRIKEGTCIVMEYYKYSDIDNFRKNIAERSVFEESFLCYLSISVLNAIKYIHECHQIIHIDIKPQNILINEYLNIKLTDFSISFSYKGKNEDDEIILPFGGTCYFMSPEILDENKRKIKVKDASKIDLYSFGVTLYVLTFSDYPYELREINNKDYSKIKESIENNELKFPPNNGCSQMFINFLENLLNKDINKRYNITEAINHPWIKGGEYILDEKEKLYNSGKFLVELLVNGIKEFNDYVYSEKK